MVSDFWNTYTLYFNWKKNDINKHTLYVKNWKSMEIMFVKIYKIFYRESLLYEYKCFKKFRKKVSR